MNMLQESVSRETKTGHRPGEPSPHTTVSPQTVTMGAVGVKVVVIRGRWEMN